MIQALYFADAALGRIERESLSQFTLMELFIEKIFTKDLFYGAQEAPDELDDWAGLTLNVEEEVIVIDRAWLNLRGFIDLQWLPHSVKRLNLAVNSLEGSVDLTVLPAAIGNLNLGYNEFSGRLDFTKLPRGIASLSLSNNHFSGECDFSQLPVSLTTLNISNTGLSGMIVNPRGIAIVNQSGVKVTTE